MTVNHMREKHRITLATQKLKNEIEVGKLRLDFATSKLTIDVCDKKIKC